MAGEELATPIEDRPKDITVEVEVEEEDLSGGASAPGCWQGALLVLSGGHEL